MNCIIIDDDGMSRQVLEKLIEKTDFLTLVHSFSNAVDAITTIKNDSEIHLIFLDIEMPEMTGLEFLDSLKNLPQVIIVSAKEDYAFEAFEYDVADYLKKPVTYSRFFRAVDRVRNKFKETGNLSQGKDEIFIKKNSSLIRLKYDDILWIEALENYVVVNTYSEKYTILFTMKAITKKLPNNKFRRVHRSFIINQNRIDMIEDNSIVVKTQSGSKIIPIGKNYKEDLMNNIDRLNQ